MLKVDCEELFRRFGGSVSGKSPGTSQQDLLARNFAMEVLFMLIGCSLLIALLFLGGFFWAVRSGQYEDRYTPAIRMLFDDVRVRSSTSIVSPAARTSLNQQSNQSGEKTNAE